MDKSSVDDPKEPYAIIEAKVTKVTDVGFNFSFADGSSQTQSGLNAQIINGGHKGESVQFTLIETNTLATLAHDDIIVFKIDKKLLDEHLSDLKNGRTLSRLIENNIKIISINGKPPRIEKGKPQKRKAGTP